MSAALVANVASLTAPGEHLIAGKSAATNLASLTAPGEHLIAGKTIEELKAEFDALELASEKLGWIVDRWCREKSTQIKLWEGDKELVSPPEWNQARNYGQMRYDMGRLSSEGWKSISAAK